MDMNDPKLLESIQPQELNGREDEKQGVLECIADSTASTSAQRNPRDASPVDRFDARLVLAAQADDVIVVPRIPEGVNLATEAAIRRDVGIGDVANPHRTAATVIMTATQAATSIAL